MAGTTRPIRPRQSMRSLRKYAPLAPPANVPVPDQTSAAGIIPPDSRWYIEYSRYHPPFFSIRFRHTLYGDLANHSNFHHQSRTLW